MKTNAVKKSREWAKRTLVLCSLAMVATTLSADQEVRLRTHNGQYVVVKVD